jgi:hypothetical protein
MIIDVKERDHDLCRQYDRGYCSSVEMLPPRAIEGLVNFNTEFVVKEVGSHCAESDAKQNLVKAVSA